MRNKLFILLCCAALVAHAQSPVTTLQQLYAAADANNEMLRQSFLTVDQRARDAHTAFAQRLPRVDVTGSYTRTSETGGIDLAIPGLFSRSIRFGDGNMYDLGITASMPIFTGFKLSSMQEAAEKQLDLARISLESQRFELHRTIDQTYYRAQWLRIARKIVAEQEALVDGMLRQRTSQVANASALPIDTLLLSTRKAQLALEKNDLDVRYESLILQLMQITGIDARFDVPDSDSFDIQSPIDFASLKKDALENRSDLKTLAVMQQTSAVSRSAMQSAYYPTIGAFASYKYARPGVDQVRNEWMHYSLIGVKLDWNILAWGATRDAVESTMLDEQKITLRIDFVRRSIETQLNTLSMQVQLKRESIALLDRQERDEAAKFHLTKVRFDQGMAVTQEIIDAETALTLVRLKRAQARIDYRLTLVDLTVAVGKEL